MFIWFHCKLHHVVSTWFEQELSVCHAIRDIPHLNFLHQRNQQPPCISHAQDDKPGSAVQADAQQRLAQCEASAAELAAERDAAVQTVLSLRSEVSLLQRQVADQQQQEAEGRRSAAAELARAVGRQQAAAEQLEVAEAARRGAEAARTSAEAGKLAAEAAAAARGRELSDLRVRCVLLIHDRTAHHILMPVNETLFHSRPHIYATCTDPDLGEKKKQDLPHLNAARRLKRTTGQLQAAQAAQQQARAAAADAEQRLQEQGKDVAAARAAAAAARKVNGFR